MTDRDLLVDLRRLEERYQVTCTGAEILAFKLGKISYAQMATHLAVRAILATPSEPKHDVNRGPIEE